MMNNVPSHNGSVSFRGYRTWYHIAGTLQVRGQSGSPVLLLHGGPGATHFGLLPLAALAGHGRAVIFYDQLGCGYSDQPKDVSLWSFQLFLDEIDALRDQLGLEWLHLFGHDWGGMLALEYALMKPRGLLSLTLASTFACGEQVCALTFEEYASCRRQPWPGFIKEVHKRLKRDLALYMWSPTYTSGSGELAQWDIRPCLADVHLPVLITAGRYDGYAMMQHELLYQGLPQARLALFTESAHFAHAEETGRYLAVLAAFLRQVEQQTTYNL